MLSCLLSDLFVNHFHLLGHDLDLVRIEAFGGVGHVGVPDSVSVMLDLRQALAIALFLQQWVDLSKFTLKVLVLLFLESLGVFVDLLPRVDRAGIRRGQHRVAVGEFDGEPVLRGVFPLGMILF